METPEATAEINRLLSRNLALGAAAANDEAAGLHTLAAGKRTQVAANERYIRRLAR